MANPRIYVACLASYNAGTLYGRWFDLSEFSDSEELQEAITAMLKDSPEPCAEEWAIHDHEGFDGIEIGEYEPLDRLMTLSDKLQNAGDSRVVAAAVHAFGEEWERALEEGHRGSYEREGDYAEELAGEMYKESELGPYASYIDWERVERDMVIGGDLTVVVVDGTRYLFTSF